MWFDAVYLVAQGGESGRSARAMEISNAHGISYNAAWRIKHKLISLMNNRRRPLRL